MTSCAKCGTPVVPVPGDARRGPEGLARCTRHAGEPLDYEIEDPEPEEGVDYHLAETRRFTIHYEVTVTVEVDCWKDHGRPLPDEPDPKDQAWEKLREGAWSDAYAVHTDRHHARGSPWKVNDDGEPFSLHAFKAAKMQEEYGSQKVPDGPRPEESLEVFV